MVRFDAGDSYFISEAEISLIQYLLVDNGCNFFLSAISPTDSCTYRKLIKLVSYIAFLCVFWGGHTGAQVWSL